MKKMTLKEAKANLKKDYIDALAFFADYIAQFDEENQEYELEMLDEKIFERANSEWDLGEEWLIVYSALLTAI